MEIWTKADDERHAELMEEFDFRKRLDTPARDMVPGTVWDSVLQIEQARLSERLKAAMIAAALRNALPGDWTDDRVNGIYGEIVEVIAVSDRGGRDRVQSDFMLSFLDSLPQVEPDPCAAFEDDTWDISNEAICKVLGQKFEPCERQEA